MVALPDRGELAGLAGLVVGFVVFTFGVLGFLVAGLQPWAVGTVVGGSLVGFAASAYLVVHYHVVTITGT